MNNFLRDILDQPHSLEVAYQSYITAENLKKMAQIASSDFDQVIFAGMGSSHDACYGASIYLNQRGFKTAVYSAGQLLHYESRIIHDRTLLILVSQSGESAEIVNLIAGLPSACPVVAITNDPQSTLGRRGNFTFLLNVAPEESISTRTYGATLILLSLIAKMMAAAMDEQVLKQIDSSLASLQQVVADYQALQTRLADFLKMPSYLLLLGRGFSYSTIFAGGLFVKEVAKFPSISLDSAEFRHGPLEMVDSDFHAVIFAPQGPTYGLHDKLARDIIAKGGKVVFITNREFGPASERLLVIKLEPCEELLMPIVDIVPVQLIANYLAEAKGLEVGKFRWSSKITAAE
ncbi:glucosamine--fructose-6-phosphate aminotransferase (isomerizing) [Hydrogenispora ethanolica]|uniref:Glutamine--fructose-6-phosphate aminotransferase [isomerizing] n=1 Tax=Hydrogenispora ethanolica TaxID=1082276 RepID=A0A4R1R328_HYDET|nr:SIS domain-containing protein [Hydrogenispora ethanolica]TCL59795.1 glucosamine--fructose-6-phosphate aminotransferase (isomerizing) [Hydrogenispora ethanolica]